MAALLPNAMARETGPAQQVAQGVASGIAASRAGGIPQTAPTGTGKPALLGAAKGTSPRSPRRTQQADDRRPQSRSLLDSGQPAVLPLAEEYMTLEQRWDAVASILAVLTQQYLREHPPIENPPFDSAVKASGKPRRQEGGLP
jgi:hypothetical protein